jgi:hypothetical protein
MQTTQPHYSRVLFSAVIGHKIVIFFLFPFGVLRLMLPLAPEPYGLLHCLRIGLYNLLHQFRVATHPEQRKLEF